jgi:hypothetical protein
VTPFRLARRILERYPRDWRARYGDEVRALLDDGRVTWADVIDLSRGCLSEWKVALADPEHHPRVFQFVTGLEILCGKLILLASFLLPSAALAVYLRRYVGPAPDWIADVGLTLYLVIVIVMMRSMIWQSRSGHLSTPYGTLSGRQLWWWVPLAAGTTTAILWTEGLPDLRSTLTTTTLSRLLIVMMIVMWFLSVTHRARFMLDLASEMGSRRYLLHWAKLEVARCEGLDRWDPTRATQLASAHAEVERLERELQLIYAAIRDGRPLGNFAAHVRS